MSNHLPVNRLEIGTYPAIVGVGAALPDEQISNQQLINETGIDSTADWIQDHTGIEYRYRVAPDEYSSTLAVEAARLAISSSRTSVDELSGIYLGTITADYISPSTATLVHDALDAPENSSAVDINAACAGALMGLEMASNRLFVSHRLEPARSRVSELVIGVDTLTRITNFADRASGILFGDGAGAVVVKNRPDIPPPQFAFRTRPDLAAMLIPAGGLVKPASRIDDPDRTLKMNGRAVKEHALNIMPWSSREVAKKAGLYDREADCINWEEIDYFVAHQANGRLIEDIGRELEVPDKKCIMTVAQHANTSAASMFLALAKILESGEIPPGNHRILFTAMGVGFVGGAALMNVELD